PKARARPAPPPAGPPGGRPGAAGPGPTWTSGPRTTWPRSWPTWPASGPAGSPGGSSTPRGTRCRCTATPNRSSGSSAPARGSRTRWPSRSSAPSARCSAAPRDSRIGGRDGADDGQGLDEEVDRLEELEQVALLEDDLAVHDRALRVVPVVQRLPVPVVHRQHVGRLQGVVRPDDPAVGHRAAAPLHEQVRGATQAGQVPAAQRPGRRVHALEKVEEVPVLLQLDRP